MDSHIELEILVLVHIIPQVKITTYSIFPARLKTANLLLAVSAFAKQSVNHGI